MAGSAFSALRPSERRSSSTDRIPRTEAGARAASRAARPCTRTTPSGVSSGSGDKSTLGFWLRTHSYSPSIRRQLRTDARVHAPRKASCADGSSTTGVLASVVCESASRRTARRRQAVILYGVTLVTGNAPMRVALLSLSLARGVVVVVVVVVAEDRFLTVA